MFFSFKGLVFRKFRKIETRIHELNYHFWECTTRCNRNCLHCGSDCHVDSTYTDMPLEDFLKALDTIEKPAKNFIVALTGGEPLSDKGVKAWRLCTIIPIGRAKENPELNLTDSEFKEMLDFIAKMQEGN